MSIPAKAYAAFDPHSPLVPWEIARRDPGPKARFVFRAAR